MKKPEEYLNQVNSFTLREDLYKIGKQMMKDTIEYTLQQAVENAEVDVNFMGWLAEESIKSGEPFIEGEDYEVYIINSSILNIKDKLLKEVE